jgi:hypothetical protein
MRFPQLTLLFAVPAVLACSTSDAPTSPLSPNPGVFPLPGDPHRVTGHYTADIGAVAPIIASFELNAWSNLRGDGHGLFRFRAETTTGTIDFTGRVTCLAVDEPLARAWIGGVIIQNRSTRPTHDGTNPIHRIGHDVWFRVADRSGEPDRTTSLGFEGSLGILTSAEYCAARPWGNDGVPLLSGDLVLD